MFLIKGTTRIIDDLHVSLGCSPDGVLPKNGAFVIRQTRTESAKCCYSTTGHLIVRTMSQIH
jgi:hypothetical protein